MIKYQTNFANYLKACAPIFSVITLCAIFNLVILSFSAVAESFEPLTLEPESFDEQSEGKTSGSGESKVLDDSPGAASESSSVIFGEGDVSIEVNVLEMLGPDMAGILNSQNGGFEADIWHGTKYGTVNKMLEFMPIYTKSAFVREIMRKLFLTQAIPPAGITHDGEFIQRRLELLAMMGDVDSVRLLLDVTPGRDKTEKLIKIETDLYLVNGQFSEVCINAKDSRRQNTTLYWEQLNIFCNVLSGALTEAQLGLSLLREVGFEDEHFYQMLESMIAGETPLLDDTINLSSLNLGVIRASGALFDTKLDANKSPAILAIMASNKELEDSDRLHYAEMATMSGLVSINNLQGLYKTISFSDDALMTPLSTAEELNGPMARALLYQVASRHTVDGARAEVASFALQLSLDYRIFSMTAKVFNSAIKRIPPRTDLIWFAGLASRALMITDDLDSVNGWINLLRSNAILLDEAQIMFSDLIPIMMLMELGNLYPLDNGHIDSWKSTQTDLKSIRSRLILYYGLMEGLGHSVKSDRWDSLGFLIEENIEEVIPSYYSNSIDPVLWQRLLGASRAGKKGETVLLATVILGDSDISKIHPLTVFHVAEAMTMIGFKEEAKKFALEVALASGL